MRVYEFARQEGVSGKDLLKILVDGGFASYTHVSVLKEDALLFLKKHFFQKNKNQGDIAPKPTIEKSKEIRDLKIMQPEEKIILSEEVATEVTSNILEEGFLEETEAQKFLARKQRVAKIKEKPAIVVKKFIKPTEPQEKFRNFEFVEKKKVVSEIAVEKEMPLFVVADLMGKPSGDLILALMKKRLVCNRNFVLSIDQIEFLAQEFGITVIKKTAENGLKIEQDLKAKVLGASENEMFENRWPIVVVMGHVDHGKTTLLDFIRKTRVAAKEKGGITQHLGAYVVNSSHGKIVFLDTPGHAAFSHMRSRGAKVTDMAILVVAADDGIMPQTIEALKCAQAADVPIIVAINKIDKIESVSYIEKVKRQLVQYGLTTEDWGGSTICVPISAKTGKGVEELLEMIVLQAQMMDLKAFPERNAEIFVLETSMEKGHGPVATIIGLEGTLKVGDYFIGESSSGKVRLIMDGAGEKLTQVGPSIPVKICGFDQLPFSGERLKVVSLVDYQKGKDLFEVNISTQPNSGSGSSDQFKKESFINLIIKCDTFGTSEAVLGAIKDLSKQYKDDAFSKIRVVASNVGDITEKDVDLASGTNAFIIGMNVKVEKNAANEAKILQVDIHQHGIIYKLVEFLDELLKKSKKIKIISTKIGSAVVLKVFDIKGKGIITGARVKEGTFSKDGKVTCIRDGRTLGGGKILSLQKDKKSVKEVGIGSEFAFFAQDFQDWQVDDVVECFVEKAEQQN